MDGATLLILAAASCLTLYVVGIGGATAEALRVRERWRQSRPDIASLQPAAGRQVVLHAPSLNRTARVLRVVGWIAFGPALVLALFADSAHPWVIPVTIIITVALNAFYFTAMQSVGEEMAIDEDGFRLGTGGSVRSVRWIHVTALEGARVGAFTAIRMSEAGEWQDPKARPNVVLYRLNRALVATDRTLLQRLGGFGYYDGVIRNAFGLTTAQLLDLMRSWWRRALDESSLPLTRTARAEQSGDHSAAHQPRHSSAEQPAHEQQGDATTHLRGRGGKQSEQKARHRRPD